MKRWLQTTKTPGIARPVILVVGLCLIASGGLLSLRSIAQMKNSTAWIDHTHEFIRESDDLLVLMLEIESESRYYLITGEPITLQRFAAARERIPGFVSQLRVMAGEDPGQQARLQQAAATLDRRVLWAETQIRVHQTNAPAAVELVRSGEGRRLTDITRQQVDALQTVAEHALKTRREGLETQQKATFAFTGATALGGMMLVGVSGWMAMRDNQRRAQMETRLREAGRTLVDALRNRQMILDNSQDVICTIDGEGRFVTMSAAAATVWGYSPEELVGRRYMDLVCPEDHAATQQAAKDILAGRPVRNFENRYLRKDGVPVWILWSALWSADEGLMFCVARDITERKTAEAEQRRLTAILDATPDYVGIATPAGAQLYINRAGRRMVGLTPDEPLENRFIDHHYPPEVSKFLREQAIPTAIREGFWFGESCLIAADGRKIPVSQIILAHTREDGEVECLSTIGRDITPQKKSEAALGQAKAAAEMASQAKSQFLANMSHELRTPLNAIIGFSEIMEDQTFGPLNSRQAHYVANVLSSGRHLLQLINDILDLAKIEAGRLELHRETFAPGRAVEGVLAVVKALAQRKNITLATDISPDLPVLRADSGKFKQVLYNLLSNAVKFTPEGGTVTVKVELVERAAGPVDPPDARVVLSRGRSLRISVSDTGIGIKPEDMLRLFQEFEQLDSTYGRQQGGTGLGLALTKRLVELHGGEIHASSGGAGMGSTFTLELPMPQESKPGAPHNAPDKHSLPESERGPLVLVVEDEQMAQMLMTDCLRGAGYEAVVARTGMEALQIARTRRPFAITLDILLPDRPGWEVLSELKTDPVTRHIPVIVVSITDDKQLGYSLGAVEFLVKPVNRAALLEVVARAGNAADRKRRTILIVDDEPESVEPVAEVLRQDGHEVLEAVNGPAGIVLAGERKPDLIILDLLMPVMSGFDVVERLRSDPRTAEIPILIYTSKDLTVAECEQLNRHVQGITSKSGREQLLAHLARLAPQIQPA